MIVSQWLPIKTTAMHETTNNAYKHCVLTTISIRFINMCRIRCARRHVSTIGAGTACRSSHRPVLHRLARMDALRPKHALSGARRWFLVCCERLTRIFVTLIR
jgi:hypothetical protein